jgi:hypothetical protein
MRQEDYLMREINKIGIIISAILNKIFRGKENLAITPEKQMEETKEILLNKANFNLDKFLILDTEESNEYISNFDGFNIENLESLAKIIFQIGFSNKSNNSKKYLKKALQLYEFCSQKDKVYSLEREININMIKNSLSQTDNNEDI